MMPAGHPNLRLACDRCHNQKLRCTNSASTTDCDRCLKANTPCVHSPTLRFGRKAASRTTQNGSPSNQEPRGDTEPGNDNADILMRAMGVEAQVTADVDVDVDVDPDVNLAAEGERSRQK